jgi:hypothetical protein
VVVIRKVYGRCELYYIDVHDEDNLSSHVIRKKIQTTKLKPKSEEGQTFFKEKRWLKTFCVARLLRA